MRDSSYWAKIHRTRMSRRHVLGTATAGALGIVGSSLVGCGDDDDGSTPTDTAAATTATTPTGSTAATSTATPRAGGTLRFPWYTEPPDLDPHRLRGLAQLDVNNLVYSGLMSIKGTLDKDGIPITEAAPDLAVSWEQPDEFTYTFTIRTNAKFANDTKVTPDDIKYSLQRISTDDPSFDRRGLMSIVQAIDIPDDKTLTIRLAAPNGGFFNQLLAPFTRILSRAWVEGGHDPRTETMGSGPFRLEQYDRGVRATFKRSPDYYESGLPYLENVEYLPQRDAAARLAAFRSGQADLVGSLTLYPVDQKSLQSSNPDAVIQRYLDGNLSFFGLNWARPPFNDPRVRQALAYALDQDEILATIGVWAGDGVRQGFLPVAFREWAVPQDEFAWAKPDQVEAKRLLAAAGHPDGFETSIVVGSMYPFMLDSSQAMAAQLRKVGIKLNIDVREYADFHAARTAMDYDTFWIPLGANIDPEEYFAGWYRPKVSAPIPQLDQLLDKQRAATDESNRIEVFKELQRYLGEELPVIPFMWGASYNAWQPYVKGFSPLPILARTQPVKHTWLDKG